MVLRSLDTYGGLLKTNATEREVIEICGGLASRQKSRRVSATIFAVFAAAELVTITEQRDGLPRS